MRRHNNKIVFFIGTLLAIYDAALSSASNQHERQRRAMLQALKDNDLPSLFTSPQEQRSQYYIHEGLPSAFQRSLRMTNFDSDLLWEYLDDSSVISEEGGGKDSGMAYSQFLEEVLTGMIKEVEDSLQKLTAKHSGGGGEGGHDNQQTHEANNTAEQISSEAASSADYIDMDPESAFYMVLNKAHSDLHCDDYKNVTIDDPKGKWNNMTKAYWKFFNMDPPPKLDPPLAYDDGYYSQAFYTTDGNVYYDFLRNGNVQVPYLPKRTTQRGMFAARDFERGELVFSFMANGIFFLQLSTFETFIRNSTLLSEHDACLLAKWSFAQKLTRPGRYYICSSLDEGAFFNEDRGKRVNVYMEDSRDLKYYAARKIAKGEEIVYRK